MKNTKRVVCCICVAALLTAVFWGCVQGAKRIYWDQSQLHKLNLDMDRYAEALAIEKQKQDTTLSAVRECNQQAVPVTDKCRSFLEKCDEAIIHFFNDVYQIDVSKKINELMVMRADYPEELGEMIGGSYSGDVPELEQKLFLNGTLLDGFEKEANQEVTLSPDSDGHYAKMLRTVYIHECIHYLGFSDDAVFKHSIEAFTEALNEKIIVYSGWPYESVTGYWQIQKIASQILESDPQLVSFVLEQDSFSMGEYFDEVLGEELSHTFDNLVFLYQNSTHSVFGEIPYLLQYITNEYTKAAGAIPEEIPEGIVPLFELQWLLRK